MMKSRHKGDYMNCMKKSYDAGTPIAIPRPYSCISPQICNTRPY
ncbi:hypothetical protein BACSTE_03767 [Bacteroides stercoris ATCC 43183]|uniref:Uncharacterized protein n=1 Tax=Bacteroides stercoris ATCC 43183 TaxID=449673 RepID=B0NW84_BACSE|nr:hypothetical protein BACSTE_03767 [Bacteroides stercoris ATCC 43183]